MNISTTRAPFAKLAFALCRGILIFLRTEVGSCEIGVVYGFTSACCLPCLLPIILYGSS